MKEFVLELLTSDKDRQLHHLEVLADRYNSVSRKIEFKSNAVNQKDLDDVKRYLDVMVYPLGLFTKNEIEEALQNNLQKRSA